MGGDFPFLFSTWSGIFSRVSLIGFFVYEIFIFPKKKGQTRASYKAVMKNANASILQSCQFKIHFLSIHEKL